ncbi:asparagine synthetase B family protein [Rugamonas sp. DEMB1]|uniref:asparagine synthetase B family protein n=1 Tax=Rugamonas sp. DEMB1 TaxID=3039386 RepID=UPI002446FC92|nr:asparagine synthase C-terminal domain-containing protein [Rugamonas sp. DEMB1]WGG52984.1 asparagine synthase C-terminal domain-containing protein [Rugamonas sp. DEMB1]
MSGVCGWLGAGRRRAGMGTPAGAPSMRLLRMARELHRFDGAPLQTLLADGGALAVAAHAGSAHLHSRDGLLVALWGRPQLAGAGGDVATAVAQRWQERGLEVCAALSGPFALCLLDSVNGQALLAVDRAGCHALQYQCRDGDLLFASSLNALQAHPQARRELDPQSLYNYLYFHTVPGPATVHQDCRRLLPGEYLHFRRGAARRGRYWQIDYDEAAARPFAPQRDELIGLLEAAVRRAAGAHAVGAFLGGGTDSSTLAAMLGRVGGAPARTYSIGFDVPGYDEAANARLAARHVGSVHHEHRVTADEVVAAVPRLAAVFDQPFGDAAAVPAFYCAQMARADGVHRLLGGDGGAELFGGNERYARQAVLARYERLPAVLRQALLEPLLFRLLTGERPALLRKARRYIEQAVLTMPARLGSHNLLQGYGPGQVLERDFLAEVDAGAPLGQLAEAYSQSHGLSQINRLLALDLRFTLADNDLPKVNKACELAGVEVGYPLLDDALVAFAARLAPRHKLDGVRLRPFFKQALREVLPGAVLRKRKHGFGLPLGHWLQRHAGLQALAYDSLSDLKARRIVRADFIDTLLGRHLPRHPGHHGTMVWVLMMLEQWFGQRETAVHPPEEAHDELEIRQG